VNVAIGRLEKLKVETNSSKQAAGAASPQERPQPQDLIILEDIKAPLPLQYATKLGMERQQWW
jgi:hypothetical protein